MMTLTRWILPLEQNSTTLALIEHQTFARYTNKSRVHDGHRYCMLVRIFNSIQQINDNPIAMPNMRFLGHSVMWVFSKFKNHLMPKLETLKLG